MRNTPTTPWLDDLRRDVRFGLRSLVRSPAFTAVAVLCLALGIGANAAIFSVLNAVLLRPLPYPEPQRLVRIWETMELGTGTVSIPNYRDWVAQATGFAQLATWRRGSANLQGTGEPERVRSIAATPNLFQMLNVEPRLGRAFDPLRDEPGKAQVAVIGEGLWRKRFGADSKIVGRTLRLDGRQYEVIGVMPAAFDFPPGWSQTDLWVLDEPSPDGARQRGSHFLNVAGRLKRGVSLEQATAQLKTVAARIAKAYPVEQTGRSVKVLPLQEAVVGDVRPALWILSGAVALVLLIACANVANLLLARAAVRQREVAIRLALGASRARLVRQFLVESVVLALAGAVLGVLLARWSLTVLGPLAQGALPLAGGVPLDFRVFLFLLGVSLLSGLAFGIVPALQSARGDVRDSLTETGKSTSSRGQQRFRSGLVVAEIAVTLVLLVGAGLLLRGFRNLSGTEPGLVAKNVLTAHLAVPVPRLPTATARTFRPVLDGIRRLPEVRAAALVSMLPIQSAWTNGSFTVVGRPAPPPGKEPIAELRVASPQFFQALGIPIRRGRDFEERDGESGPRVVIVNEAFARRIFPGAEAVGQRLRFDDPRDFTIAGVVGDVRQAGLGQKPLAEVYFPYGQADAAGLLSDASLVIRTDGPPGRLAGPVREAVRRVDSGLPLYQVLSMEEVIDQSLASHRLNLWLLAIFAGMALVLSAAGLYGVISYLVAQRTREIGVRVALGAQKWDVIGLVMRQGAGLAAAGIALGLLGALAFTQVLASLLYGVSARDPLTYAALAALFAAVALAATWLPAERASRVDPLLAIRNE
ncbi:MAG TPA: ABC transporter permease [Thermoanaerobaculia bacterium]|nr:ABC transporter permease [Thermoanaerobaculia bacterium]